LSLRQSLPRRLVFTALVVAAAPVVAATCSRGVPRIYGDDGRNNKVSWQQLPYMKALGVVVLSGVSPSRFSLAASVIAASVSVVFLSSAVS